VIDVSVRVQIPIPNLDFRCVFLIHASGYGLFGSNTIEVLCRDSGFDTPRWV
jgi:hypothetical protein